MSRQARRDTAPEVKLRSELHHRGLRFRVSVSPLAGLRSTADIVFPRARVVVYVDGCFWHSCPEHGTMPASNRDWWQEKLARNQARDRATDEALMSAGWNVVRVWEHESAAEAADRIEARVRAINAGDG
jgi:DNA mismatch endonuclease (patch repair protein)